MNQTILAFGYKKQRGKDTACNFVKDHLSIYAPNLRVVKVGFADKLKDIAFQLWGWVGLKRGVYYEEHYNKKEVILPQLNLTPRQLWIGVGNKMREIHGSVWIEYILNGGIDADVVLIKDVGYRNEALAVRNVGGYLYKLERDGPLDSDPRETELDSWTDWDKILDNTKTLRYLHGQIIMLCTEVFEL